MSESQNRLRQALESVPKPGAKDNDKVEYPRQLTHALVEGLLEHYALQTAFPITQARKLIEVTYPRTIAYSDNQEEVRRQIIETVTDPVQQQQLMDFLVRAAHLHQLSSLIAHEKLLQGGELNSPLDDLLSDKGLLCEKAIEQLKSPVMDFVFTAHPTNTNSVDFMASQRALAHAVNKWQASDYGDLTALNDAMNEFASAPILPHRAGKTSSMTPMQEIDYMLYFLENAYADMDRLYSEYDAKLKERFGHYKPADLKLNVKFHSWGSSGDKDGNQNVNANTTLYAVAAHRAKILEKYVALLERAAPSNPALKDWLTKLSEAQTALQFSAEAIKKDLEINAWFGAETFEKHHAALKKASTGLEADAFMKALDTCDKTDPAILSLTRKFHHFGFSMGAIEYRETAEEYERVVAELIPEYGALCHAEKEAKEALDKIDTSDAAAIEKAIEVLEKAQRARQVVLEEAIANPHQLQARAKHLKARAVEAGASTQQYDKVDALPIAYHTLKRMELARDFSDMIGNNVLAECQNASNMLEALVLQHAVMKDGKRAMMGIVPLFEEYQTLANAPRVIQGAHKNPVYKEHQRALATIGDSRETPQVQFAHSDNARRAGSIGSRAAIYEAQAALQKMGVRRYQGGSLSDPYRDGVRSVSGKINEFQLHDFAKMTVQGGDLLNYFNLPHSMARLIDRNIANSAEKLKSNGRKPMMNAHDKPIYAALMQTIPPYEERFKSPEFSAFIEKIGYKEQQQYNFSSRAGARGVTTDAPVDVQKVRTISFSETLEHAGIVPVWIGAKGLREHLQTQLGEITPTKLHTYYQQSPLFKDVIDRMLYAVARTSFTPIKHIEGMKEDPMLAELMSEYDEAVQLSMEAYTGQSIQKPLHDDAFGLAKAQRRLVVQEAFSHVRDFFADQDQLMRTTHEIRRNWLPPVDEARFIPGALMHNAMDTVHHGRNWLIDDPAAARAHCSAVGAELPYDRIRNSLQK